MKTIGKITQEDMVLVDHRIELMSKQMPIDEENPPTVTYSGFIPANPWNQIISNSYIWTIPSSFSFTSIDWSRAAQQQAQQSLVNQQISQMTRQYENRERECREREHTNLL